MQYGPNIASNFFYAPVDFAEERRVGREVGSMNKLRDMAKGFDFNQPNAGEKFRSEGYKIDPLQTERDYGSIISKFDERQLQQATALREKAGRAWLKIGSLPEQQRPIAWQEVQRDPELASVFDEPYSPEAYMGKESEFQSLDEALKAAAVKRKNEQIRSTLGLGQPGQPRGAPPTNYRASLARLESGGNDAAAAPGSSAKGRYQFIDSTWAQLGMDPALVNDPNAQEQAMDKFLEQNAKTFQAKNGRLPNDAEQYAYHWFGPGNGQRVLTANQDTPIERIIGQKTAENNGLSGQTAGQVRSALEQRMGTGTTWTGEPQGSDLPPPQPQSVDTSPQAIFASLPQWQQQDVLNSAGDAEALQKIGKYASETQRAPQTAGDMQFVNGQWIPLPKPDKQREPPADHMFDDKGGVVPIPGGPADPRNIGNIQKLEKSWRDEFKKPIEQATDLTTQIGTIRNAAQRGDGTGDIAAITSFNKLLDPGAVVREADVALTLQAQGLADQLQVWMKNKQEGDILPPELRQRLLALSENIYATSNNVLKSRVLPYAEVITGQGAKFDNVIPARLQRSLGWTTQAVTGPQSRKPDPVKAKSILNEFGIQ